jgi:hypothetical protein
LSDIGAVTSSALIWINLLIATNNRIAIGITNKNVACHPKLLIIFPPMATPITAPAENIELNIP